MKIDTIEMIDDWMCKEVAKETDRYLLEISKRLVEYRKMIAKNYEELYEGKTKGA